MFFLVELFPRYMLEVLQSLVNWPMGEVSIGSRCLAHTFYFMENYFTCVINPLFTYKLYPVFAGVIGKLSHNSLLVAIVSGGLKVISK